MGVINQDPRIHTPNQFQSHYIGLLTVGRIADSGLKWALQYLQSGGWYSEDGIGHLPNFEADEQATQPNNVSEVSRKREAQANEPACKQARH